MDDSKVETKVCCWAAQRAERLDENSVVSKVDRRAVSLADLKGSSMAEHSAGWWACSKVAQKACCWAGSTVVRWVGTMAATKAEQRDHWKVVRRAL